MQARVLFFCDCAFLLRSYSTNTKVLGHLFLRQHCPIRCMARMGQCRLSRNQPQQRSAARFYWVTAGSIVSLQLYALSITSISTVDVEFQLSLNKTAVYLSMCQEPFLLCTGPPGPPILGGENNNIGLFPPELGGQGGSAIRLGHFHFRSLRIDYC